MNKDEPLKPRRRGGFRRLLRRIADWFSVEPEPPSPPAPPAPQPHTEEVVHRARADAEPITALCRGDVFEFQVYADLVWSTSGTSYEGLTTRADKYGATAMDNVREKIWRTARGFPPHQAAAAEAAIQGELGRPWCYTEGTLEVRCSAAVRVLPDPRVRAHLLNPGYRELDIDVTAGLGTLHSQRLEELTIRWREVLISLGHEPETSAAARLADRDFAAIVGQLAEKRRESVVELIDLLRGASKDHMEAGLFEFATAYDTALQAFRRQMGLENGESVLDGAQ